MVSLHTLLAVHPPPPPPRQFSMLDHPCVGTFDRERVYHPWDKTAAEVLDDLHALLGNTPHPLSRLISYSPRGFGGVA